MGILLVPIVMGIVIWAFISIIFSFLAYSDGKKDTQREYRGYSNDFWMPMAYFYDKGYNKYEGSKIKSITDKNRERFGRK